MTPRPTLQAFAEAMETTLKANDHKGGWSDCTVEFLLWKAHEELGEIAEAIYNGRGGQKVGKECTDLANFAFFLWDNLGGIGKAPEPEPLATAPEGAVVGELPADQPPMSEASLLKLIIAWYEERVSFMELWENQSTEAKAAWLKKFKENIAGRMKR